MTTAFLIHGFSGSPAGWRRVEALLDVPSHAPAVGGHGAKAGVVSFGAEVGRLAAVIRDVARPPRFVVGYSLGGRLALGLLVRHPDLFCGGTLIGANPGIGCETEREVRRQADERWARLIEDRGLATFDREWSALPLFRSQRGLDGTALLEQRRIRLGHDPSGLAAAMRAFSLGAMPDYRPVLPGVLCPVDLIAGSLDTKFVALARNMAGKLPDASVHVVEGAGHNVPLEAPAELARLLNATLGNVDRDNRY
ncbi:MAG: alpha/beta fold hydrolase [Acidobacteria bacterium]|nr:alpha/beta fold hydrolase [Acidobacteriota bacterium]